MVAADDMREEGSDRGAEVDVKSLFLEFLRHFPLAKVEDYYQNGRWLVEQLQMDLELVLVHRREAGAPDAPPLEEAEIPDLPDNSGRTSRRMRSASPRPRDSGTSGRVDASRRSGAPPPRETDSAGARRPLPPKDLPNNGTKSSPRDAHTASAGPSNATQAPTIDRTVSDFIQRCRLDRVRATNMLERLAPDKRRAVMRSFKVSGKKGDPTEELKQHIQEMTQGTSTSNSGSGSKTSSGTLSGSSKRPVLGSEPDAKRLRTERGAVDRSYPDRADTSTTSSGRRRSRSPPSRAENSRPTFGASSENQRTSPVMRAAPPRVPPPSSVRSTTSVYYGSASRAEPPSRVSDRVVPTRTSDRVVPTRASDRVVPTKSSDRPVATAPRAEAPWKVSSAKEPAASTRPGPTPPRTPPPSSLARGSVGAATARPRTTTQASTSGSSKEGPRANGSVSQRPTPPKPAAPAAPAKKVKSILEETAAPGDLIKSLLK